MKTACLTAAFLAAASLAGCAPEDRAQISREMSEVTVEGVPFPSGAGQIAWIRAEHARLAEENCAARDGFGRCRVPGPARTFRIDPAPSVTVANCTPGTAGALSPVEVSPSGRILGVLPCR